MDNNAKKNSEEKFHEGGFDFKKFEKMAEMMRSCCTGGGGMMDCCSMIRKMMEEGKRTREKDKGNAE